MTVAQALAHEPPWKRLGDCVSLKSCKFEVRHAGPRSHCTNLLSRTHTLSPLTGEGNAAHMLHLQIEKAALSSPATEAIHGEPIDTQVVTLACTCIPSKTNERLSAVGAGSPTRRQLWYPYFGLS